jgi:hypothetical protein
VTLGSAETDGRACLSSVRVRQPAASVCDRCSVQRCTHTLRTLQLFSRVLEDSDIDEIRHSSAISVESLRPS